MHFMMHNPVSLWQLWITFVPIELFHHIYNKNVLIKEIIISHMDI